MNPDGGRKADVVCAADEPIPDDLRRRGLFDFLLCTKEVEYVADWHSAFANFSDLLAPGNRVLITAPFIYQLRKEPYDFWRPTLQAMNYYPYRVGLKPLYRQAAGDAWDVIGTILTTCQFVPTSSQFLERGLARAIGRSSRLMVRKLRQGKIQSRVRAEAPLDLSNVVVLEKSR